MKNVTQTTFALLLPLILGCAHASAAKEDQELFGDHGKISASDFTVQPPPASDRDELDELLKYQNTRTQAQCDDALGEGGAKYKDLFNPSTGVLSEQEYASLKHIMKGVSTKVGGIVGDFKDHFQRPRPYVEDPSIHPCGKSTMNANKTDYSYPSGHSTLSSAVACLLSSVYPERTAAFNTLRDHIGLMRQIGGFHHKSDVVAGFDLGNQICRSMLEDPKFKEKLAKAAGGN